MNIESLTDIQTEVVSTPNTSEIAIEWPEPEALPDRSRPAPFPVDALPDAIKMPIIEAHENIQAPVSMIAASALSAMSLAIQSKIDVARNDNLISPVSIYSMIIAESGDRKSSVDKAFTDSIRSYQNEIAEKNKPLMQEYLSTLAIWQAERDGILRQIKQAAGSDKVGKLRDKLKEIDQNEPTKPHNPKYLYQNFSIEGLRSGLSEWPSAGIFSAEAGSVLGSYGMRKESVVDSTASLNCFWSGEQQTYTRLVSASGTLENCRMTLSVAIQQGALDDFLNQSGELARSIGLLARCLISCPESLQGTRMYREPATDWPHVAAFNARIREILNQPDKFDDAGRLKPDLMRLSPAAKAIWIAYYNAVESELKPSGDLIDVRDFASKSAEQAVRIAALIEYFGTGKLEVSSETMTAATTLAGWYLLEARRYFGLIDMPEIEQNAVALEHWLKEHSKSAKFIEKQYAGKFCPYRLRKAGKLDESLQYLAERRRLMVCLMDGKKSIVLNPKIVEVA
jgi:hypothetical protein